MDFLFFFKKKVKDEQTNWQTTFCVTVGAVTICSFCTLTFQVQVELFKYSCVLDPQMAL